MTDRPKPIGFIRNLTDGSLCHLVYPGGSLSFAFPIGHAYSSGRNAAYTSLFGHFAREIEGPESEHAAAIYELGATRAALRRLSEQLGCNDWSDNLHLADVVEKYIGRCSAVEAALMAANEGLGK